jgi:hypothetical protein
VPSEHADLDLVFDNRRGIESFRAPSSAAPLKHGAEIHIGRVGPVPVFERNEVIRKAQSSRSIAKGPDIKTDTEAVNVPNFVDTLIHLLG